jgi:hypothetical protein
MLNVRAEKQSSVEKGGRTREWSLGELENGQLLIHYVLS